MTFWGIARMVKMRHCLCRVLQIPPRWLRLMFNYNSVRHFRLGWTVSSHEPLECASPGGKKKVKY